MHGAVAYVFLRDISGLSFLILGLTALALVLVALDRRDAALFWSRLLPYLGFIGTMIGFLYALSGVDPSQAGDVDAVVPMVTKTMEGVGTAITTTLAGLVGHVWVRIVLRLT